MDAIIETATRNDKENNSPRTNRKSRDAASTSRNISLKVDRATQELHIKFYAKPKQHILVIHAIFQV